MFTGVCSPFRFPLAFVLLEPAALSGRVPENTSIRDNGVNETQLLTGLLLWMIRIFFILLVLVLRIPAYSFTGDIEIPST